MKSPVALAALALAALVLASGPLAAKPPMISSAYSRVDLAKCRALPGDTENGTSMRWRCPGYRGLPLYVEFGDERYDLDGGTFDHDGFWSASFDELPRTVEWRLKDGRPFAIIYRLTVANAGVPKTSRLIVESVGDPRRPTDRFGCRIAEIAGSTPGANGAARAAAAGLLDGTALCMEA